MVEAVRQMSIGAQRSMADRRLEPEGRGAVRMLGNSAERGRPGRGDLARPFARPPLFAITVGGDLDRAWGTP
jgi:hypothetical protein